MVTARRCGKDGKTENVGTKGARGFKTATQGELAFLNKSQNFGDSSLFQRPTAINNHPPMGQNT
jgi:hypothetical protein